MKKIIVLLVMAFAIQVSAQELKNLVTDYKVALQQSESQDKLILVFVTDNQMSENSVQLQKELFSSEAFEKMTSKLIILKLDISDKQSYNYRLGVHYIKKKSNSGIALVDKNNNTIGKPLVDFNSKNIQDFLSFLESKI